MKSSYQTILVETSNILTTVTLNRPEVHNAFNEEMIAELTQAFLSLSKDPKTRVVLLMGNGPSFCAGADLHYMKKMAGFSFAKNQGDAKKLHRMLDSIYTCSKPVIVKAHGAVMGGGLGLVAAADMALAIEDTMFSFSEVRLGLIPAVISPFVIKKIGEGNAREYFLTAEKFSAQKACEMGLIQYRGIPEEIEEKLSQKIQSFKTVAPGAVADCKKLIQSVVGKTPTQALAITTRGIAKRRASVEGKEGMKSFFEKRKPNWVTE